jgi:hypothetical protein
MTLHADARKLNWSMIGVIVALILRNHPRQST